MNVYIYAADIYCEDCGKVIRERIDRVGSGPDNPKDENTYDSDEYPKGPYPDGGGEADCPQHCGSMGKCINTIRLSDGTEIGCFLENPLTQEGKIHVTEAVRDIKEFGLTGVSREVTEIWKEYYLQ